MFTIIFNGSHRSTLSLSDAVISAMQLRGAIVRFHGRTVYRNA